MQKKIIEHKLRKIQFDYDDSKPWTGADEKLLSTFIGLHDWEQQRKELGLFLLQHYRELDKRVEQAREMLNKVKETFTATRTLADALLALTTLKKETVIEAFYHQLEKTSDELMKYDGFMRAIEMKELEKEKVKYFEDQNHLEPWDQFSEANLAHSKSYPDNSIDGVSFDRADNEFRMSNALLSSQADRTMDHINKVIENHSRLMLETEMQYELWKEFNKRVQLFQHFTGRDKPKGDYFNSN